MNRRRGRKACARTQGKLRTTRQGRDKRHFYFCAVRMSRRFNATRGRGGAGPRGRASLDFGSEEILMNPEPLSRHFGSCNAIGYLLERDIARIVGSTVIGLHIDAEG
jgi:hypothetical protein